MQRCGLPIVGAVWEKTHELTIGCGNGSGGEKRGKRIQGECIAVESERNILKRVVGPRLLIFVALGNMLGAGIYALVGEMSAEVGGAIWASFLLALVLAVFTASSYAELATKYPRAGGAATYVHNVLRVPFVSFLVTFALVASAVNSAATLSLAVGGYMSELLSVPIILTALLFLLAVGLINLRGVSGSVRVNALLTIVEIIGLLFIVLIGAVALLSGTGDPGRAFEFREGTTASLAILAGASLAFYAFIGFEDSVNMAEETQSPERTYPKILFGSLAIAGVLYLLVAFTASMVVDPESLAGSSGPLLEVVRESPVAVPEVAFAIVALLAVANGALINVLTSSRMLYGMADQRILPSFFARVHPTLRTPWIAVVFSTALAVVLLFTGEISILADTTVVLLLSVFVMVNVCVLLSRRYPVEREHYKTPFLFPILGIIVSLILLTQQDAGVYLRVGALLAVGIVLWGVNTLLTRRSPPDS